MRVSPGEGGGRENGRGMGEGQERKEEGEEN